MHRYQLQKLNKYGWERLLISPTCPRFQSSTQVIVSVWLLCIRFSTGNSVIQGVAGRREERQASIPFLTSKEAGSRGMTNHTMPSWGYGLRSESGHFWADPADCEDRSGHPHLFLLCNLCVGSYIYIMSLNDTQIQLLQNLYNDASLGLTTERKNMII